MEIPEVEVGLFPQPEFDTTLFPAAVLASTQVHHGIHFDDYGTHLIALGHWRLDDIVAAFDHFVRAQWHWDGLLDGEDVDDLHREALDRLVLTWACHRTDCGETDVLDPVHGTRNCRVCIAARAGAPMLPGIPHDPHGCDECLRIKFRNRRGPQLDWSFDNPTANAGKPGWFPVTIWKGDDDD